MKPTTHFSSLRKNGFRRGIHLHLVAQGSAAPSQPYTPSDPIRSTLAPFSRWNPPLPWCQASWKERLATTGFHLGRDQPERSFHTSSSPFVAHSEKSRSKAKNPRSNPRLEALPDKVDLQTGPLGRLSKLKPPQQAHKITTRVGSSFAGNHSLKWVQPPNNVLIVKKRNEKRVSRAMADIMSYLGSRYPHMNIIVEEHAIEEDQGVGLLSAFEDKVVTASEDDKPTLAEKVDFVITLGGDGTILHVSSLFDRDAVPPVLSFSMGTLGFLLPYDISAYKSAIEDLMDSRVSLLLRMRLRQTSHAADGTLLCDEIDKCHEIHLMNEVTLHRGREPHMTKIDAYVDGQYLTQAISDGLIISTPTGSTAYSLSAGGPIVHPSVQSLVLTPISPRSLSFRTVLLPSDSTIQLKISSTSRSPAELTVDGKVSRTLSRGEYLQVSMSPYPIPCVNRSSASDHSTMGKGSGPPPGWVPRGEDDWLRDINTLLKFNVSFGGRGSLGGHGRGDEDE
ncbi:ATP-NAD kinase [Violaceomyces palustris]|uniref:ATP-NAD kinase n=1 Tax=Violaceomyces palustris TaxID=1673888 RepID=A0ACD0P2S1_9BASI|nr:ATP-NAD kinase [Violaceomyces palustris]